MMEKLTTPSVVRRILCQYGVSLQKSLGQHFLVDANVLQCILEAIPASAEDRVIEIGAGIGTLTVALAPQVGKLFAVEIDPRLIPILQENVSPFPNVKIVHADFQDLKLAEFGEDLVIVGNLPYGITSEVLLKLVRERGSVSRAVFTVQWEVGEKLVARPGPNTTRLAVHLRAYYEVELLRKVSRTVFFPPPEVDGALVRLFRLPSPAITATEEAFARTLALAFQQRRKTLRHILAKHFSAALAEEILKELELDPRIRAEALDIQQWDQLALALSARGLL
ncbi:MAG: 16S rRNA (adenine(1518)-N(6)/adenine(1519)-N(6))-dimethyltransferase RsmA [Candidatus Bipolaricaulota bacterium]|nr:16S rRNA (adenine(1518)-N(6)/adenine(1519)-N(6))-dimethyltransferase RsmA [Candidatus Bipolaricaulota bacterium]MDW8126647.1 16S rRNA (adenine(1518)-N(6)/adenine(1519)-N(6))-dimethyltransferase RsmA [Candidatus Bipolaricaulota bacterium]